MNALATSARATAIARTFAAAFEALREHGKRHPAEAQQIAESLSAHLRSAYPMSTMLDTGPVAKLDPVASVERELADGSRYHMHSENGCTVLRIRDADDDIAVVTLTAVEATRLRADVEAVNGG